MHSVRISTPKNCVAPSGERLNREHVVHDRSLRRLRSGVRAPVRLPGRGGRRERAAISARSSAARRRSATPAFAGQRRARRVAILNQKGGTGKTTTAVNLAAGIADRGYDVLLVDIDAQGNVGASLGIRGERTLYHVLVDGRPADEDVIVPVRGHLDVITSDATLAAAEMWLARLDERARPRARRAAERRHARKLPVRRPRLRPVAVAAQPERALASPTR